MAQVTLAMFSKAGHWTKVSEIEILSLFGTMVDERRYVVFSKAPGKELRQFNYSGVDAKRHAMEQFEFIKSTIDLNQ